MTSLTKSLPLTLVAFVAAGWLVHEWREQQGGVGWGSVLQGDIPVATIGPEAQPPMTIPGATVPTAPALETEDLPLLQQLNAEYSRLVEAVMPSVVSINTQTRIVRPEVAFDLDQFGWRRFDRHYVQPGLGSGVIVSAEGHVITNYHVVSGVDQILVRTADGRTLTADVVGFDEEIDVAVLQITPEEETEFPALSFGDSDEVKVGELVFAVGNPFGLSGTVTQGIISAKERRLSESGFDLFQTDTVINPGNSGGPLVNLRGEIIGLNVAIFSGQQDVRVWQGVGLAIPSNDVEDTFAAIMGRGRPVLGYLGVDLEDVPVDPELAGSDRAPLVVAVEPGSPAEQAGLQAGDILLKLGGRSIRGSYDFLRLVRQSAVGRALRLTVLRDDQQVAIEASVAERPRLLSNAENGDGPVVEARTQTIDDLLGIEVRELVTEERRALSRLIASAPGILVTNVREDSPTTGLLQPGDLMIQLNNRPLFVIEDFQTALNELPLDQEAVLRYLRGRRIHTLRFMPRG